MARDYKYPHSVINSYLADWLDDAGVLPKVVNVMRNKKAVPYGTIIGEEMVPEFAGASVATNNYIVFSIARDDSAHTEYQKNDTVLYNIYTKGKADGLEIVDEIINALGRRDFTTDDLMDYQLEKKGRESFHFFDVEYNVIGTAAAQNNGTESGYYLGTIIVRYSYTYEMDNRGRRIKI